MAVVESFDRSSLTDKVYVLLKKQILAQALGPGQKVDIDRLAADLGISRTPIKDALNRLASDGLVTVLSRRGTFVARFDLDDLLEMLDVRLALESYAAEVGAATVTETQLAEMRDHLLAFELAFPDDQHVYAEYDDFLRRDRRFHLLLVTTAGNRRLREFCEGLHTEIQMARAYYTRGDMETHRVHAEHRAILAGFERRDGAAAARAVREHLGRVKRSLRPQAASRT